MRLLPLRIRRIASLSSAYLLGDVLGRGAPYLLVPIYTFFLSADEFGILAFTRVIQPIAGILISFGMQAVAFRFYFVYSDKTERKQFYGTIWIFLLVIAGILTCIITILGMTVLQDLFSQIRFHPYLTITIWAAYFRTGFELIYLQYLRAKQEGRTYFVLSIISFLLFVSTQLVFVVVLRRGVTGALLGNLIAVGIMAAIYSAFVIRDFTIGLKTAYLKPALAYGLPLVPHLISNWGLNLSDRVILDRFVSLAAIGIYSLADQFRQGYQVMSNSVEIATRPIYGHASVDNSKIPRLPRFITYYLLAIITIGMVIVVFAPDVLRLIAPPEYGSAGRIIPWLILGMLFQGLYTVPMNILTQLVGETKGIAGVTLIAAVINISLNLLLIPKYGIMAAAVTTTIGYLVLFALMLIRANRRVRLELEYTRIAKAFAVAIVIVGATLLIGSDGTLANYALKLFLIGTYPLWLYSIAFFDDKEKRWGKRALSLLHNR